MTKWIKVFFLFFIFGLLVYFNSLNNKFLIDDYAFLNNPVWSSTKFISSQWNPYREQALGVVDAHEMQIYYRPTAHIVYDFCYANFKDDYWKYHLLNIFLFVLASSLIFVLIEKISGNYALAFLTGLFYLVHPINGIIVNYISASVFAFQVIFTLGAIVLLLESLEKNNNRWFYFLSLLFSFLSLFWNESGVMTPFYLAAVILLFRKEPFKKKALYLFPYFLMVFSYIVFRFFFISLNDIMLKQIAYLHMNLGEYLGSLFKVFMWYISQLFYPRGIVMAWTTPIGHGHLIGCALGACLLLLLFILLVVKFAQERILQMALAWLIIGFAPVCLAAFRMPENGAQIEPHWFVVSSIGFFMILAYYGTLLFNRTKKGGFLLLGILILTWATVSHAYNRLWFDQKTYARYWSQEVPNLKSTYFYLADAYQREGSLTQAKKYYTMALAGVSSDLEIYNNLGMIDEDQGNWKGAELNYRRTLKIHPFSAATYCNLGDLYYKRKQWEKARQYFNQSLMLDPLLVEPKIGLVDVFLQKKDFVNLKKYAYLLINSEPSSAALTKLGILMARHNFPVIAFDAFEKAIRIDPAYKDAYLNAGVLLANSGEYNQAIHIWKIGLGIDPSDQRFYNNITKTMVLKRNQK